MTERYTLIEGDCIDAMPKLTTGSIDAIVCCGYLDQDNLAILV